MPYSKRIDAYEEELKQILEAACEDYICIRCNSEAEAKNIRGRLYGLKKAVELQEEKYTKALFANQPTKHLEHPLVLRWNGGLSNVQIAIDSETKRILTVGKGAATRKYAAPLQEALRSAGVEPAADRHARRMAEAEEYFKQNPISTESEFEEDKTLAALGYVSKPIPPEEK